MGFDNLGISDLLEQLKERKTNVEQTTEEYSNIEGDKIETNPTVSNSGDYEVSDNTGDKDEESKSFLDRFKSNMSDYFDENPSFDFTNKGGQSTSDKVAAFTEGFEGSFDKFGDNFGIFQQKTNPMTVLPGQQGSPGFLEQIAGPVAGAAAKAAFASMCDIRTKHDISSLTDMNLVRDDLADIAYFVKELQDS
jgi:hypothetical protein